MLAVTITTVMGHVWEQEHIQKKVFSVGLWHSTQLVRLGARNGERWGTFWLSQTASCAGGQAPETHQESWVCSGCCSPRTSQRKLKTFIYYAVPRRHRLCSAGEGAVFSAAVLVAPDDFACVWSLGVPQGTVMFEEALKARLGILLPPAAFAFLVLP